MATGRKLTWRKSAGFTPSTLDGTESEKNAMPNDMANRACRTVAQMGCMAPEAHACAFSSQPMRGCGAETFTRRRWVSTPDVDARIFVTRLTGGSTSVRFFSQLRPAVTSANSGLQAEQVRA